MPLNVPDVDLPLRGGGTRHEGVDRDGAERAFDILEQLAGLVAVLDDMGPIVRRTVQCRLRRAGDA